MNIYFLIGMFSTLSFLNTFLTQVSDSLLAGSVSLLGGSVKFHHRRLAEKSLAHETLTPVP